MHWTFKPLTSRLQAGTFGILVGIWTEQLYLQGNYPQLTSIWGSNSSHRMPKFVSACSYHQTVLWKAVMQLSERVSRSFYGGWIQFLPIGAQHSQWSAICLHLDTCHQEDLQQKLVCVLESLNRSQQSIDQLYYTKELKLGNFALAICLSLLSNAFQILMGLVLLFLFSSIKHSYLILMILY